MFPVFIAPCRGWGKREMRVVGLIDINGEHEENSRMVNDEVRVR